MTDQEKLKVARECLERIKGTLDADGCRPIEQMELSERIIYGWCFKALSSLSSSEPEKCPECEGSGFSGYEQETFTGYIKEYCQKCLGTGKKPPEPSQGEDDWVEQDIRAELEHPKPSPQVDGKCWECYGPVENPVHWIKNGHPFVPSPEPIGEAKERGS